jgi:excisionase family DNA binding protein
LEEKIFLNTKQVAELLNINGKMVYSIINEKGLPAVKATGKWLFPKHLVEQWLEGQIINCPKAVNPLPPYHGLLIVCGSNDVLLEKTMILFNRQFPEHAAVFGNMGSLGGLKSLKNNLCHMAISHLLQGNEKEYNFNFVNEELGQIPAVVNFCLREQGILVQKGNPGGISGVEDLKKNGIKIVNRPHGTGTRLMFDGELKKAGIDGNTIEGYDIEMQQHLDVGLEVLSGRADAGPAIKTVASLFDLDFIPMRMERFDLIVLKERFFDRGIHLFLDLLRSDDFKSLAKELDGYDLSITGEMVFPHEE